MNGFNLKNYIPIFIVIFFLVILTGGSLLIWPKHQESNVLQKAIKVKKEEIRQTEDYFKRLIEIKNFLETDYKDALLKVEASLPSSTPDPMPSLLKFLQESAGQSGLILKSIGPSVEDSGHQDIKALKISLDLGGSYISFKNYMSTLENSSRLIETENFSFSSESSREEEEKDKEAPGPSSFNLQIKAFSH